MRARRPTPRSSTFLGPHQCSIGPCGLRATIQAGSPGLSSPLALDVAAHTVHGDRVAEASALSLLDDGRWEAAREAFEHDLASLETPEAHDGLSRVEWLMGNVEAALRHRERAYLLWKESGDRERAAIAAAWLAREHHLALGSPSTANGWLARAGRMPSSNAKAPVSRFSRYGTRQQKRHTTSSARSGLRRSHPSLRAGPGGQ